MNKTILIVVAATLLATASFFAVQPDEMRARYQSWKVRHQKKFATFEEEYRFDVYVRNYNYIQKTNSQGNSFHLAENKFMDITDEEFEQLYLGSIDNTYTEVDELSVADISYPATADHSAKLNTVKNQGQCGSCWSFSAIGALEAYLIIQKNVKQVLAEQQLVDCDTTSFGCDGGYANYAIDYLNKNGAVLETSYPYTAADGTCKQSKGTYKGSGRKTYTTTDSVYDAISRYPVSVSVHASNWKLYDSGIFSNCINTSTNHAVVAVGYDQAGNWKIRNSWGADWGVEGGHIWLASGNTCGVLRRIDQVI